MKQIMPYTLACLSSFCDVFLTSDSLRSSQVSNMLEIHLLLGGGGRRSPAQSCEARMEKTKIVKRKLLTFTLYLGTRHPGREVSIAMYVLM